MQNFNIDDNMAKKKKIKRQFTPYGNNIMQYTENYDKNNFRNILYIEH